MTKIRIGSAILVVLLSLIVGLVSAEYCLAAKGGHGGKPGGSGSPPLPDIRYTITPVNTPDGIYWYEDHNNADAVVGWNYIDGTTMGRRSFAYLPSISTAQASYLDDPALAVSGIPDGWHTRSALGINNLGTIVGNLEPDGTTGNAKVIPFLIPDIYATTRELEVLDPFDLAADRESVTAINDNGDIAVLSVSFASGARRDRVFVGNPGLYEGQTATPYTEIGFAAQGIANPIVNSDVSIPRLTNPVGNESAILISEVKDEDQSWIFRTALDGSNFEKLPIGEPLFTDSEGTHSIWDAWPAADLNDNGDVLVSVHVEGVKGRGKNRSYSAIWREEDSTVVPVPGADAVGASFAETNENGDFLLDQYGGDASYLWNADWSLDNGPVAIADLIDPNDPNRALFTGARELTDRNATGWPTLITNSGGTLLILQPHVIASSAATAVPEPATLCLLLVTSAAVALLRRDFFRSSSLALTCSD